MDGQPQARLRATLMAASRLSVLAGHWQGRGAFRPVSGRSVQT
jgi:hypothetical protein